MKSNTVSPLLAVVGVLAACLLPFAAHEAQGQQSSSPSPKPASLSELPAPLTPKVPPTPRINGAKVFGVRPGAPFLYTIPATGERPMTFSAKDLPAGLKLDAATGSITGLLKDKGEHLVILRAKNARGAAERKFRIVVGDQIALTPPLGWNSWNCWGGAVSQEKVLGSARAMVAKGLRDHGWTYINIDDGWQGVRGGPFHAIQPNSKFPDMKALAEEIHLMGLKFGIYSTPWRGTYEGHIGSSCDNADGTYDWIKAGDHNPFMRIGADEKTWNVKRGGNYKYGAVPFFVQDAKQWADWGVDYLKYDWRTVDVEHTDAMRQALAATGRDILYSLSNSAPLKNGADWAKLANAWRTTGDIVDTWKSMSGIGFNQQEKWTEFAGPGHWNDPDMLVVGQVGWGPKLHATRLTADEQYTHLSLWALLSAPLLIGCNLEQMDEFTLGLLTNDEVLDVDQDPLGKQGCRISKEGDLEVFAKPLEDGSWAVGLFNRGESEAPVKVKWADLQRSGKQQVRDLWRQKDLGVFTDGFEAPVPPHGVVLVRIIPAK